MHLTMEVLPNDWRENLITKVFTEGEEVLLLFFCGYWGMERPETLHLIDYLNRYEFALLTNERILKFPPGWGDKLSIFSFQTILEDGKACDVRLRDIKAFDKQKYMQCSDIILKLIDKEVRLEKCPHIMAEKLYRYLETRIKGKGLQVSVELGYQVEWGAPVAFQVMPGSATETLNVMFLKPSMSPHTPPTARIAQYQEGRLIREYILEPKRD